VVEETNGISTHKAYHDVEEIVNLVYPRDGSLVDGECAFHGNVNSGSV
jgi:hypothetical protein